MFFDLNYSENSFAHINFSFFHQKPGKFISIFHTLYILLKEFETKIQE